MDRYTGDYKHLAADGKMSDAIVIANLLLKCYERLKRQVAPLSFRKGRVVKKLVICRRHSVGETKLSPPANVMQQFDLFSDTRVSSQQRLKVSPFANIPLSPAGV
jgi:hypothetical protein